MSVTRLPDIRPYRGKHPQIAASAYIDPASVIVGDVVIYTGTTRMMTLTNGIGDWNLPFNQYAQSTTL